MFNILTRYATTNAQFSRFQHRDKENGFTMLELMIVVVIIAILAGFAIPVYANYQQTVYESALKSDMANANKRIQQEALAAGGKYPSEIPANFNISEHLIIDVVVVGGTLSQDGTYYLPTSGWKYCLEGYTDLFTSVKYSMDLSQGVLVQEPCITP